MCKEMGSIVEDCGLATVLIEIKEADLVPGLSGCLEALTRKGIAVHMFTECAGEKALEREMEKAGGTGCLLFTENSRTAVKMLQLGQPAVAYLHEGNRTENFDGVVYAVEGFEEVDADYVYKLYQRLTGKPWHILDTERCRLRETTETDVDAFYRIYAEPGITRYMEDLFADREEELIYIKEYREKIYGFYGFGMWTVEWKETGEVIGRAGLGMREGYEDPELGFVIALPWQGKGLAGEVCLAVLAYGREVLGFQTVQALVETDNLISLGLCRRIGFREAERVFWDGREHIRLTVAL